MEKKGHGNPRACVHIHAYAHACSRSACACFMHVYTYTGIRVHAKVPKTMKGKFSALKIGFGTNPTLFGSHSKPHFFTIKGTFSKDTENLKRKHKIH